MITRFRLLAPVAVLFLSSSLPAQTSKTKQKKDDLPDVALQIPEETRPEVRAMLKQSALGLKSRSARERLKAAQVLGELGEAAKPARRLLCAAMLDPALQVRVASADALKVIDPKLQYLAVAYVAEPTKRRRLLAEFQKLKEDGEPLTPLVVSNAKANAASLRGVSDWRRDPHSSIYSSLLDEMTTLSVIAPNDQTVCRLIASNLETTDAGLRRVAIQAVSRMKHGKNYVSKIARLVQADVPGNRMSAIEALVALVDDSTEEIVTAAIESQRYHEDKFIRQAVDVALNKIRAAKKSQGGDK